LHPERGAHFASRSSHPPRLVGLTVHLPGTLCVVDCPPFLIPSLSFLKYTPSYSAPVPPGYFHLTPVSRLPNSSCARATPISDRRSTRLPQLCPTSLAFFRGRRIRWTCGHVFPPSPPGRQQLAHLRHFSTPGLGLARLVGRCWWHRARCCFCGLARISFCSAVQRKRHSSCRASTQSRLVRQSRLHRHREIPWRHSGHWWRSCSRSRRPYDSDGCRYRPTRRPRFQPQ
jgi:hypothetical protein